VVGIDPPPWYFWAAVVFGMILALTLLLLAG
jgi:hypothetical protein